MREVLGGCLAVSEGDGYDVLDRDGRKWEVRSIPKEGSTFVPLNGRFWTQLQL